MTFGASPPDSGPQRLASVVPLIPVWRLDRAFDYRVPHSLGVEVGSLVRVPFGRRRVRGVVVEVERRVPDRPLEDVAGLVVAPPMCPPPLDRLISWVSERYCAPRGLAFRRVVPPRVRVGVGAPVALRGGPAPRRILAYAGGADLVADIERARPVSWSLQTVPGDDRGEVISELVAAAGRAGGSALVLVPEVRFGAPTLEALARHWPHLARVDAARPDRDRSEGWLRLATGHGLGAGGRAGVLAPTPRLRLMVIDEEHSPSYKEDRTPRYDARRVGLERARLQAATCVLASPTPSLEAALAVRRGQHRSASPTRAARRGARPVVEVLPLPRAHPLAGALPRRVTAELRAGGRVALLAPARGYARVLWCAACHRSLRCPRCETGLAYDRHPPRPAVTVTPARVRCPRCRFMAAAPRACPKCGSAEWRYLGAGRQRLTEQVRKAWPRATVRGVDVDDLEAPATGRPPDIYVTTWIGTKEVLRPDASLVAVLDADALIRRPEWWAAEGAYHALAEMAGWAGPASKGGRLLVQCSEPGHHAVQAVVRADHGYFVERELEQRAELNYPPFSELLRATAAGPSASRVLELVARECRAGDAIVLGPTRAGGPRGGAPELLAKCPDAHAVALRLRGILGDAPAGTRVSIDVDPR
jgi:primosomal protein N' (replication factor Y)